MKMFYGNIPVNSMKIKHYEMNTNDSNLKPSDMQTGKIAYGKGKRIVGTGKAFEFAIYGDTTTTSMFPIPNLLNTLSITSSEYFVQMNDRIFDLQEKDFTVEQEIGKVIIEDVQYPIKVIFLDNMLKFTCDKTVSLQFFCGRDNYI